MNKVIGVCGFIGSGKGTVGEILIEQGYVPLSFAGTLKDAVSAIFGWPRELLEGDTIESRDFRETVDDFWTKKFGYPITPRIILQTFGTEVCRNNLLDSIWIDSLEKKISQYEKVVITDVRFPNELEFLDKMHAAIIHVDREETRPDWYSILINDRKQLDIRSDIHPSEYLWFGSDYISTTIENNGTIEDLKRAIDDIVAKYDICRILFK